MTQITKQFLESEIQRIVGLADEHKIDLDLGDVKYKYADPNRPTIDDYWDGIDEEQFPDWDYVVSGWQSSSTFC